MLWARRSRQEGDRGREESREPGCDLVEGSLEGCDHSSDHRCVDDPACNGREQVRSSQDGPDDNGSDRRHENRLDEQERQREREGLDRRRRAVQGWDVLASGHAPWCLQPSRRRFQVPQAVISGKVSEGIHVRNRERRAKARRSFHISWHLVPRSWYLKF
jgi:hypothetical protein